MSVLDLVSIGLFKKCGGECEVCMIYCCCCCVVVVVVVFVVVVVVAFEFEGSGPVGGFGCIRRLFGV